MTICYSLEALSSYIQSQRELLTRTHHEIERLHTLKNEINNEGDLTVDVITQKVRFPASFAR